MEKGITLLEIIITLVLLGILSIISIPHFFILLKKNELSTSLEQIKFVIQQAQQQSRVINKSCRLELIPDNVIRDITDYGSSKKRDCLITGTETITVGNKTLKQLKLPEGIKFTTNLNNNSFGFSFQGLLISNNHQPPKLIILENSGISQKKCLIITPLIGLIRTGNYTGQNNSDGIILKDINPEFFCQINL